LRAVKLVSDRAPADFARSPEVPVLSGWHLITCEFPPRFGGVSDYCGQVAAGLRAAGEEVHVWCDEFEGFTTAGMKHVGAQIDASPQPRRLLLQWVPHGYGRRSMNLEFCRWIARRKEPLDLMIHEAGLGFWEGGLRHNIVAAVHRIMLATLVRKATSIWMSTSAWEPYLRPYLLGRKTSVEWAPAPSNIPVAPKGADADYAVGYFGQYDAQGIRVLMQLLDIIPDRIALIGRGAERVPLHERTIVIGEAHPERLSRAIASCQVMCHHYVDGITGRRTTAMASLAHGKATVTVDGRLTEPLWRESGAVSLAPVGDASALAANIRGLLSDRDARTRLGQAAWKLYNERFSLDHTIGQLLR
jgi:glycosyltransferase involved in cell wall biosynthesis